jgi:acetoin utilization deacetylase AcuC-like enzyme
VAAAHALEVHGGKVARVAVVDFDVHHGNGSATMAAAWPTPGALRYFSTHQVRKTPRRPRSWANFSLL